MTQEKKAPQFTGRDSTEPVLGAALFRVARATIFDSAPEPELDALPLAQLRLLMTVHRMADATMKDFSQQMQVSQSTVTQLAERLVRRGFIERHTDSSDRRVVRLRISPHAQAIMTQADKKRRGLLDAICNALTPEQQAEVLKGLETLAEAAEAVHRAQGRSLSPFPTPLNSRETNGATEPTQPVVDLMARRVRGKIASE